MIVALNAPSAAPEEHRLGFTPGCTQNLGSNCYKSAYTEMASRANLTLEEAIDKRYEHVKVELQKETLSKELLDDMRDELTKFGNKVPGEPGSTERLEYFKEWVESAQPQGSTDDMEFSLLRMLQQGNIGTAASLIHAAQTRGSSSAEDDSGDKSDARE